MWRQMFGRRFAKHPYLMMILLCSCGKPSDLLTDFKTEGAGCDVKAGELRITEIMPNPSGSDHGREWFEITNVSSRGLQLARLAVDVGQPGSMKRYSILGETTMLPGDAWVFAGSSDALPVVHVNYGSTITLGNDTAALRITCADLLVDETRYGSETPLGAPHEAQSYMLSGDDHTTWCVSEGSTPGAINPSCVKIPPPPLCDDVKKATTGALRIEEILADPAGADDGNEWFVIRNTSPTKILLDGLVVQQTTDKSSTRLWRFPVQGCNHVQANERAVIAVGAMPLDASIITWSLGGDGLYNSPSTLRVLLGDAVIDSVAVPQPKSGITWIRDVI